MPPEEYDELQNVGQQLLELRIRLAREDPSEFCELVLRDETTGLPIRQADLHRKWHDVIDEHSRVVIWSARSSGKTHQISVGRVLYELGRNPRLRIAIVSSTAEHGQKLVDLLSQYIEGRAPGSAMLHRIFPNLQPGTPWTYRKIVVAGAAGSKDPSVQVCGVHGAIIGSRVDLLILDDILTYENCRTPTRREDVWQWIQSTLIGMLTKNSRVLCIGTAFNPEDVMHRLQALPGWRGERFPIIREDTGESAWPEEWPLARIEKRRTELTPDEFARQMLCVARDDASARFQKEWLEAACLAGQGQMLYHDLDRIPDVTWERACQVPNGRRRSPRTYTGVDIGVSKKASADETVIATIMVHGHGQRQLIGLEAGRWSAKEIVARVVDAHYRYDSIVAVETNAAQDFIRQFIVDRHAIPVVSHTTTARRKHDPELGVEAVAHEFANGKWILPSSSGDMRGTDEQTYKLLQELLFYSPDTHMGDRLAALWFARELARADEARYRRRGGVSVRIIG